jgi:hypothetical protein
MSYSFACALAVKFFRVKVSEIDERGLGELPVIQLSRVGENHG